MDRRQIVELFEVIRRGYAAGETIQGLSKKHGVHRRMVRQALGKAISWASGMVIPLWRVVFRTSQQV
jgi:hypothetical protein